MRQFQRWIRINMIPEIEDKFKIINWLRNQRVGYDEKFNFVFRNAIVNTLINNLKSEINEIAKEHGNSYLDENGNTVWVKSDLKGE